ncbi:MAG: PAS domain S-box protein [Acidobacteria bacterium]|nr:PAS domain S-box protein [Acidobacteriota bacterium]
MPSTQTDSVSSSLLSRTSAVQIDTSEDNQAEFRRAFENAAIGMSLNELDGSFLQVNRALCGMLGYTPNELLRRSFPDLTPADHAELDHILRLRFESGEIDHADFEKELVHKKGHRIWVRITAAMLPDADGWPLHFIAQVQNISAQKQAFAVLQKAQDELRVRAHDTLVRLAAVVESSSSAIYSADLDGEVLTWNAGAERLFGYTANEMIGSSLFVTVPADRRHEVRSWLERVRRGERWELPETVRLKKDGAAVDVRISIAPINDADGSVVAACAIIDDITERKHLEKQFLQAQKMEAIGQLAGGVAHDFNNLLTVISGYSQMLLRSETLDPASENMIREIHKAGERAASLTHKLLAFSRNQVLKPRVVNINDAVIDSEAMLRRLIGENIVLKTYMDPALEEVNVDLSQIDHVLMNLAINARDAMPSGGRLILRTSNIRLTDAYCRVRPGTTPGAYVMLSVTDTGDGMDEETKSHIFEPFFTTKGPAKGTGLGLAMVHGFIEQSNGHIDVHSEMGKGTTFRLYLPTATSRQVSPIFEYAQDVNDLPAGCETILLVEDDNDVRRLAASVLRGCGYNVLESCNGRQAVGVAQSMSMIDLLITDVVMPQISGRELAEQLTKAIPEMKLLYVSGYTDDDVIRHGVMRSSINFLQKPYSPASLAQSVRNILDKDRRAENADGRCEELTLKLRALDSVS